MKIIDIKNTSSKKIIAETIKVLKAGGLIIFPTETTYGAGVDATNPQAVQKLLAYKSRREGKPLSIAVANKKMASEYVFINKQANSLIDQFLPGPVTVVCKTFTAIAHGVASEFGTLGIRIPNYKLITDLVEKYGKPITATSANGSGKKRPYSISDIIDNLSNKQKDLIDLVLNAGKLPRNKPSTVIDTTLSTPVTLRGDLQERDADVEVDLINLEAMDPGAIDSRTMMDAKKIVSLVSSSEKETKEIAGKLLLKNWNKVGETGIVFALDGSLGTGKTIFTKGVAKFLGITEIVKSPTYSYIEEYDYKRHQTIGKLYHLDMWKVEDEEMCERLEIEKLFGKNNVVVIEWFDQVADFIAPKLKSMNIVNIKFEQEENKRRLKIIENQ